jgi:hypothetical protein
MVGLWFVKVNWKLKCLLHLHAAKTMRTVGGNNAPRILKIDSGCNNTVTPLPRFNNIAISHRKDARVSIAMSTMIAILLRRESNPWSFTVPTDSYSDTRRVCHTLHWLKYFVCFFCMWKNVLKKDSSLKYATVDAFCMSVIHSNSVTWYAFFAFGKGHQVGC